MRYNLKDFGKHAFNVASLTLSGAAIGSAITSVAIGTAIGSVVPGVGTAIGAGVGALLGVIFSIWNFWAGKKERVNKVKSSIRESIDDQKDKISRIIEDKIWEMQLENKIIDFYNSIYYSGEEEKEELNKIKSNKRQS